MNNHHIQQLFRQLKQQEQITTQLVTILAKTNIKVKTLQDKVDRLEANNPFHKI